MCVCHICCYEYEGRRKKGKKERKKEGEKEGKEGRKKIRKEERKKRRNHCTCFLLQEAVIYNDIHILSDQSLSLMFCVTFFPVQFSLWFHWEHPLLSASGQYQVAASLGWCHWFLLSSSSFFLWVMGRNVQITLYETPPYMDAI